MAWRNWRLMTLDNGKVTKTDSMSEDLKTTRTCGMPRKLTRRAAMRRMVATKPYSLQGSGSPGSGSGHRARRCNFIDRGLGSGLRDLQRARDVW